MIQINFYFFQVALQLSYIQTLYNQSFLLSVP